MSSTDKPAPIVITTEPGSRLALLHAIFNQLKPQFDALETQLDEAKKGIKTAARIAAPHAEKIEIRTPGCTPLILAHSEPITLDSASLKGADPLTWLTHAKKGNRWDLRVMKDTP